jgi:hypothetical protein
MDDDNTTHDPKEKLRSLAERIQVGDTDEGADAIGEMIGMVRDQGANRENVRAALREEFNSARIQRENQEAVDHLEKRFPQLKDKRYLSLAAGDVIKEEIIEDFRSMGVSDEELAKMKGCDVGQLAAAHGHARLNGGNVRKPIDIADKVGTVLTREFDLKPRNFTKEQHEASQREYVSSMRRDRGLAIREQPEKPAGAADYGRDGDAYGDAASLEARQERVRQMRIQRGFPVSR